MDREGGAVAERRARVPFVDSLFVESVSAFVHGAEESGERLAGEDFCRDADVVESDGRRERMNGGVLASAVPVVAHASENLFGEPDLFCGGERAVQECGVGRGFFERGADDFRLFFFQTREDRFEVGAGDAFIEAVEERVIGMFIRFKPGETLEGEIEKFLEMRGEGFEVLFFAGAFPCGVCAGTGFGVASDPFGGETAFLFVVFGDFFDEAAFIGIGIEFFRFAGELPDEYSEFARSCFFMGGFPERGELKGTRVDGAGSHVGAHIPVEQFGGGAEVGDGAENVFQFFQFFGKAHDDYSHLYVLKFPLRRRSMIHETGSKGSVFRRSSARTRMSKLLSAQR